MYKYSAFYRNGGDAEFYYPEVMELALEVINGPHEFEIGLGHQGIELTFTSQTYKVEVVLEKFLTGSCSITDVKPGRPARSACLPPGLR